jgi:hypothetical protein
MEAVAMLTDKQMEKVMLVKKDIDTDLDDKLAHVQNLVIDCIYNSQETIEGSEKLTLPPTLPLRKGTNPRTIVSSSITKKKKSKNKRRKRKGPKRTEVQVDKRPRVVLEPRGYPVITKAMKNKWKEEKTEFDETPIERLSLDDILDIFPEVMCIYMEKSLFNNTVHDKLMEGVDFEPFRKLVISNKVLEECVIVNMCKNYLFAAQLMYQFCKSRYRQLMHIRVQIKDIAEYQKLMSKETRKRNISAKSAIDMSRACKIICDGAWKEIQSDIDVIQEEIFKLIATWLDQMEEEFLMCVRNSDGDTIDPCTVEEEGISGILPLRFLPSLDIYQKTIIPMLYDILEYRREGRHLLERGQDSEDD